MKPASASSLLRVFLFLTVAWTAAADVQITTLTKPENSLFQIGGPDPNSTYLVLPFSIDAQGYTLNSITARVFDTGVAPGALNAVLYQAGGDFLPTGAALVSFSFAAIPLNTGPDTVFTPNAAVTLASGSRYAFALQPTSGNFVWIETSASNGFDQPAGNPWGMPAGLVLSQDSGASWTALDSATYPYRQIGAVDATPLVAPIPEPSAWMGLSALGLISYALCRRMNRR